MRLNLLNVNAFLVSLGLSSGAMAMAPMDDDQMSSVTGAGIAIALHEFNFAMAPTSYIELTGRPTALAAWKRGDARYYGLSFGNAAAGNGFGTSWTRGAEGGTPCIDASLLSCPINTAPILDFASVYDPYVLRAFEYEGYDFQGNFRTGTVGANAMPTVLEFIGPSNTDRWRWAFWGEIEVDRGGAGAAVLQSQSIINGRPTTKAGDPAILRVFKTQNTADPTLGIAYQSALSGDFRFSVGQKASSPNAIAQVPHFNNVEGMYFFDVDAFLPIGRLHSQALTLNTAGGTSGNFELRLTSIPNIPAVYNDIYCGALTCATNIENVDFFGRQVVAISNPNPETHGYIRWGDFTRPFTAADNGILFRDTAGNQVAHLGVARMDDVLIQSLVLTTLGAGP